MDSESELPHHIINKIPSKRSPSTKHGRIPKLARHVLRPFVVLLNISPLPSTTQPNFHATPLNMQKRKILGRRNGENNEKNRPSGYQDAQDDSGPALAALPG